MNDQLPIVNLQRVADLAWAAGIVDGEGCINKQYLTNRYNRKYGYFRIHIGQAGNKPPEMLIRFKTIFNYGKIYLVRSNKNKPLYSYQVGKYDAIKIIELIWPYLGTVKREQAIKAGFKW